MKKNDHRVKITADGLQLLSIGSRPTHEGRVFFIPNEERDIHLTFYSKPGRINLHITDSDKIPRKVWEDELTIDNKLAEKLSGRVKRCIVEYHGNEKMYVLGPETVSMIRSTFAAFSHWSSYSTSQVDILQLFRAFKNELNEKGELEKIRIKDAKNHDVLFGFTFSKTQSYLVWPIDEHHCLRINMDMNRNFFSILPIGKAASAWMKHLGDEGILNEILEPILHPLMEKI